MRSWQFCLPRRRGVTERPARPRCTGARSAGGRRTEQAGAARSRISHRGEIGCAVRRGTWAGGEAAISRHREASTMPQASPGAAVQGSTCADAGLVARLRAGDESAMARLVEEWSPAMLRVARSLVGSVQSAEDVVQDAWLGMLSGLAGFEGRSSLRTWTFSILVNRARTRGAREARTV